MHSRHSATNDSHMVHINYLRKATKYNTEPQMSLLRLERLGHVGESMRIKLILKSNSIKCRKPTTTG